MFSRRVQSVSGTSLFARAAADGRQFLVYEMTFAAAEAVAMILPLPVPRRPREDAVRFIALDKYRDFFADLKKGFPEPVSRGGWLGLGVAPAASQSLRVVDVGDFVASFVPTVDDFDRLDERFRLPGGTFDALPGYRDFGFAVFQLKPGRARVHPMAFEFPRRDTGRLFFPTVHLHDGEVPVKARFDHALYCQGDAAPGWRESDGPASAFVNVKRAKGIVDGDARAYLREILGTFDNRDVYV
jgi:hypothetical protein